MVNRKLQKLVLLTTKGFFHHTSMSISNNSNVVNYKHDKDSIVVRKELKILNYCHTTNVVSVFHYDKIVVNHYDPLDIPQHCSSQ